VVQKRIPSFIFRDNFGNSAPIFTIFFTVTCRNLWRINVKFFNPPHLYCVTNLPSKANTTANIGDKCLHFSRTSCCRSEYLVWGKKGWSSSILGRKLTAHTIVLAKGLLPDISAICHHYMRGHCCRMERQRTPPGQRWTI